MSYVTRVYNSEGQWKEVRAGDPETLRQAVEKAKEKGYYSEPVAGESNNIVVTQDPKTGVTTTRLKDPGSGTVYFVEPGAQQQLYSGEHVSVTRDVESGVTTTRLTHPGSGTIHFTDEPIPSSKIQTKEGYGDPTIKTGSNLYGKTTTSIASAEEQSVSLYQQPAVKEAYMESLHVMSASGAPAPNYDFISGEAMPSKEIQAQIDSGELSGLAVAYARGGNIFKGARDFVIGIPGSVAQLVTDPIGYISGIPEGIKQTSETYGFEYMLGQAAGMYATGKVGGAVAKTAKTATTKYSFSVSAGASKEFVITQDTFAGMSVMKTNIIEQGLFGKQKVAATDYSLGMAAGKVAQVGEYTFKVDSLIGVADIVGGKGKITSRPGISTGLVDVFTKEGGDIATNVHGKGFHLSLLGEKVRGKVRAEPGASMFEFQKVMEGKTPTKNVAGYQTFGFNVGRKSVNTAAGYSEITEFVKPSETAFTMLEPKTTGKPFVFDSGTGQSLIQLPDWFGGRPMKPTPTYPSQAAFIGTTESIKPVVGQMALESFKKTHKTKNPFAPGVYPSQFGEYPSSMPRYPGLDRGSGWADIAGRFAPTQKRVIIKTSPGTNERSMVGRLNTASTSIRTRTMGRMNTDLIGSFATPRGRERVSPLLGTAAATRSATRERTLLRTMPLLQTRQTTRADIPFFSPRFSMSGGLFPTARPKSNKNIVGNMLGGFRQPTRYTPSLIGIVGGYKTRKAPKGLLTGIEIRPVVTGKKRKKMPRLF